MAQTQSAFFKKTLKKGTPTCAAGVADGIERLAKAIEKLEVVGDDHIDAKLDWANGYPRITLKYKP